jgi:hypothetical protein
MTSLSNALDQTEAEALLSDLCVRYGFCLPSEEHDRLLDNPPQDVLSFVDAVYIAEGLNPETADRSTYRAVRDRVAESFARCVEKAELDLAISRQGSTQ